MNPAHNRPLPDDTQIVDAFLERGVDTVCIVEDSSMASLGQYFFDLASEGKMTRWVLPSERSLPAVAAGRWLATGSLTLMSMQNTGLSNAADSLRTLMAIHRIPGLVMSGWRGFDPVIDDSEPHILVGNVTDADAHNMFDSPCIFGHRDGKNLLEETRAAIESALGGCLSILRVSPGGFRATRHPTQPSGKRASTFDPVLYAERAARKGKPFLKVREEPLLSRDEALRHIHEMMSPLNPFYIVGNGYNARAMQALWITDRTFENAGAMGTSLGIAWGAAKSRPDVVFVAIDGDQNAVMSEMEKILSSDYPENLFWFILDNGVGESVGLTPSIPLSPWHYELAHVINTASGTSVSFRYPRMNASGVKFEAPEARHLAEQIGNLPAQAHLARRILSAGATNELQNLRPAP